MRKIEKKMIYGHCMTRRKIEEKYPFDDLEIDSAFVRQCNATITFDIYLAYELRRQGYSAIAWGAIYRHKRVFIIDKPKNRLSLPF